MERNRYFNPIIKRKLSAEEVLFKIVSIATDRWIFELSISSCRSVIYVVKDYCM
jgi:hypothetical protein